jgi:hypothetical protein
MVRSQLANSLSRENEMPRTNTATAVLIFAFISPWPAWSDEYPTLNVAPLCHGITEQSDLQEGFRSVSFDECMKAEKTDRETMINEWSSFSASDRTHCVAEVTMGGESSYTDLLTCLEMARDVRALHKGSGEKPEQADTTQQRKHSKRKQRV